MSGGGGSGFGGGGGGLLWAVVALSLVGWWSMTITSWSSSSSSSSSDDESMTITVWLATAEPVLTGDFVKNEETFRCCGGRFRFMAGWGGGVKEGWRTNVLL